MGINVKINENEFYIEKIIYFKCFKIKYFTRITNIKKEKKKKETIKSETIITKPLDPLV